MSGVNIARLRLRNQQIAEQDFRTPAQVVAHLGAIQAQDYAGGKWAIGLRLPNIGEADIDDAIADRTIVRTWPMRGTLHFVPAPDVRWMLDLTASRVVAGNAGRYRQLELDERTFGAGRDVLVKALSSGKEVTRQGIYRLLEGAGIKLEGGGPLDSGQIRGLHILAYHAQTGLICYGRHQGKQPAFALLDEWVPRARTLDRDEALGELAKRYFTSHGPATVKDFAWWSGLPLSDVRSGIEFADRDLGRLDIDGVEYWVGCDIAGATEETPRVHLLPPFDEYTVAYRDRSAVVAAEHKELASSGGVFRPIIVVDGKVVGTWKATVRKGALAVIPAPFAGVGDIETAAFHAAAKRYAKFLGVPLSDR
jgi:Winged helix DNA-binding domain